MVQIERKNIYVIKDDYVVGFTKRSKKEFYFDLEDFEMVEQYYWILDSFGNVVCKDIIPQISMHKLIMGDGIYIHKNGNNNDNRKENLTPIRNSHNDGKVYMNGYISIYMPEHERAFDNGCVYEHILVAEEILGRKLKNEECVHHKDKDRTNNSKDNLMIFRTNEDHIAFHGGAETILGDDGVYYCIKRFAKFIYYYSNRTKKDIDTGIVDSGSIHVRDISKKNLCPICNTNYKYIKSKMCKECWQKEIEKNIPSKEELENLIYKIPFTKIGEIYGVSDNAIRKWCKKYNLPYKRDDIKKINYKETIL